MRQLGMIVILLLMTNPSFAGLFGELSLFYGTDNFTTSSSVQNGKSHYALDLFANLENKYRFFGGFHVDQISVTDTGAVSTTFTSLNMGPMLMWIIDRKQTFSLAAGYHILSKGSYNDGSATQELTGTGLWASFGIMPEIDEHLFVGVKYNYASYNYTKSLVGSASSDIAYTRALVFPSLSLSWHY